MINYDHDLEAEVRRFLASFTDLDTTRIHVRAENGTVMLAGRVFTEEEKRLAGETIARLSGVERVVNDLQVRP